MTDPKLKQWCGEVRSLLKKAKKSKQDSSIKNLPAYLEKLMADDELAAGQYRTQFEAIVTEMQKLDPKKNGDQLEKKGQELAELKRRVRVNVQLEKFAKALTNVADTQNEQVRALQRTLDQAYDKLAGGDHAAAAQLVADFDRKIELAKKDIVEQGRLAQAHAKDKPAASRKRSELEALVQALRTRYPGLQDLERKLGALLSDTQADASREHWSKVALALKNVQLPSEEQCRLDSEQATAAAAKESPDVARLEKAFANLARHLDEGDVQPYREVRTRVMNPYLAAKPQERAKHHTAVALAADKLTAAAAELDELNVEYDKILRGLRQTRGYLQQFAPMANLEAAAYLERAEQFKNAVDANRLFSARPLAANLHEDGLALERAVDKDHKAYIEASKDLPQLQLRAKALSEKVEGLETGSLKIEVFSATSLTDASNIDAQMKQTRDWLALTSRVNRARAAIERLEPRVAAYGAFADERKTADGEFETELHKIDRAVVELKTAIVQAGLDGQAVANDFNVKRAAIVQAWTYRMSSATNAQELDLAAATSAIAELVQEARDAAQAGAIAERKAVVATQAAASLFDAEWRQVATRLDELGRLDLDASESMLVSVQTVRTLAQAKATQAGWTDALSALKTERGTIDQKITALSNALAQRRTAVEMKSKEVLDALAAVPRQMAKRFDAVMQELRREAGDLRVMGSSTSSQAAAVALKGLDDLKLRIAQLVAEPPTRVPVGSVEELMRNGKTKQEAEEARAQALKAEQEGATFGIVARDLDDFKLALQTQAKLLAKNESPRGLKVLRAALKTFESQLSGKPVVEAMADLQELQASLDRLVAAVAAMRLERQQVATALAGAQTELLALEKPGTYAIYVGVLRKQYEALVKDHKGAEEPAAMTSLLHRVQKLRNELTEVRSNPALLEQKQNKLAQRAIDEKKLEAEWKGRYPGESAWEAQHLAPASAAIAAVGGDEGQLREIRNIVKAAVKMRKNGDLPSALRQIKLAELRCQEVKADPMGAALGSRKALLSNARQYSADARTLIDLLTDLPTRAATRVAGLPPAVQQAIKAMADRASARIAPDVLVGLAMDMEDPKAEKARLREVREQAMAQTRALRELFTAHPLMVQLAQTPLNRAVPTVMRRLGQHINRFEANVSRAVH